MGGQYCTEVLQNLGDKHIQTQTAITIMLVSQYTYLTPGGRIKTTAISGEGL